HSSPFYSPPPPPDLPSFPTRRSSDLASTFPNRKSDSAVACLCPISLESAVASSSSKRALTALPSWRNTSTKRLSAQFIPSLCPIDRKSTRLNSSHVSISYAVFCLKKK